MLAEPRQPRGEIFISIQIKIHCLPAVVGRGAVTSVYIPKQNKAQQRGQVKVPLSPAAAFQSRCSGKGSENTPGMQQRFPGMFFCSSPMCALGLGESQSLVLLLNGFCFNFPPLTSSTSKPRASAISHGKGFYSSVTGNHQPHYADFQLLPWRRH